MCRNNFSTSQSICRQAQTTSTATWHTILLRGLDPIISDRVNDIVSKHTDRVNGECFVNAQSKDEFKSLSM